MSCCVPNRTLACDARAVRQSSQVSTQHHNTAACYRFQLNSTCLKPAVKVRLPDYKSDPLPAWQSSHHHSSHIQQLPSSHFHYTHSHHFQQTSTVMCTAELRTTIHHQPSMTRAVLGSERMENASDFVCTSRLQRKITRRSVQSPILHHPVTARLRALPNPVNLTSLHATRDAVPLSCLLFIAFSILTLLPSVCHS